MATDPAYHPTTTHEFTPGGRRFAVVLPPMVQGGKKPYIFGLPYPSWSGDATRSPKAEPPQSPMIPDVRICAPTPTTSLSEVAFASHPESSFARSPSRLQGESPPRPVSSSYDPGSARLYPPYHLAESVRHRTPLFDFGVVPPSTPSPSPATRSSPILPTRCSPSAHAVTDVRHVTPFPSTPVIPSAALDPLPLPSTPRHTTPRPFAPTNPAPVPSIPRDTTPLPSSPRHTTPVPSSPRHTTPLPFTPTNPTPLSSTPRRTTPLPFMPMNPAPVPSMPRDTTPVPSSPGHTTPLSSTPRHTTPLPFAPMNPSPVPSVPRGTTPLPHVARPETLTVPSGLRSNLRVSTSPTAQRVSPYPASHPVASSSRVRLEDTAGSRRLSVSFTTSSFNNKWLIEMFRPSPLYFVAIPGS